MTAGHCALGLSPTALSATIGSSSLYSGGVTYQVASAHPHPGFNPSAGFANDIAVLKVGYLKKIIKKVNSQFGSKFWFENQDFSEWREKKKYFSDHQVSDFQTSKLVCLTTPILFKT